MANCAMYVKEIIVYPIKSLRGTRPPPAAFSSNTHEPEYTLTPLGLPHDRHFMLQQLSSKGKNGGVENMVVSKYPEMCLFHTSFVPLDQPDPHSVNVEYKLQHIYDKPDQIIDDHTPLTIPLCPNVEQLKEIEVNLYTSTCIGFDMGEEYNSWFSTRFGYGVRLLYLGPSRRPVLGNMLPTDPKYEAWKSQNGKTENGAAKGGWFNSITSTATSMLSTLSLSQTTTEPSTDKNEDTKKGISFADVAPYLVVSDTSYRNVASRFKSIDSSSTNGLKSSEVTAAQHTKEQSTNNSVSPKEEVDPDIDIPITKFRPNIIVVGAPEAWEEDFWAELEILPSPSSEPDQSTATSQRSQDNHAAKLLLTQNCARCASLNVSYTTGHFDTGPAGKLHKALQRDRRVDAGWKYSPIFGRYAFLGTHAEGGRKSEKNGEIRIRIGDG